MGMLSVVKREAWRTGGVALYLFICLGFFTTLGKLVLATYQIEYYVVANGDRDSGSGQGGGPPRHDAFGYPSRDKTSHLGGDPLQDAVLLCCQRTGADPGASRALLPATRTSRVRVARSRPTMLRRRESR